MGIKGKQAILITMVTHTRGNRFFRPRDITFTADIIISSNTVSLKLCQRSMQGQNNVHWSFDVP